MIKEATVDGACIKYFEEGNGEPLVLIHGLCASTFTFRKNIDELKKYFHLFVFDLPGFGNSKPAGSFKFTAEEFVDVAADLIKKVFSKNVNILGSSMGGMIALGVAAKNSDIIKKLVLVSPYCYPLDDCLKKCAVSLLSFIPYPSVIQKVIRHCLGIIYYDKSLITDEVIKGYTKPYKSKKKVHYAINTVKNFGFDKNLKYLELANEIKIPVLLIWGKEDKVIPALYGKKLAERFSSSKLVEFEKCGHIPYEEKSEEFNKELINFLRC